MEHAAPTRRKTRVQRVIAVVVVWLSVGTTINVIVAWSGIWLSERNSIRNRQVIRFIEDPTRWPMGAPKSWAATPPTHVLLQLDRFSDRLYYDRSNGAGLTQHRLVLSRAGWPTRSLGKVKASRDATLHGQFRFECRSLPLLPLWPGFALNTLFYAAIAWLLWRIPIVIRRHRRRIRGLCFRCAYNRAGLAPGAPCPECGHAPGPGSSVASA